MLLSVGEDFPQPWEKLDPGLLGQRGGNVAQLNKGTEQCSGLRAEEAELICFLHPHSKGHQTSAESAHLERLPVGEQSHRRLAS